MKKGPFDIITISESHCYMTILDNDIHIEGFDMIRKDRTRHGGGVVIYITNNIHYIPHLSNPAI